jgi:hypothetical protein
LGWYVTRPARRRPWSPYPFEGFASPLPAPPAAMPGGVAPEAGGSGVAAAGEGADLVF